VSTSPEDDLLSAYTFDLPAGRIAQSPSASRASSRLLVARRAGGDPDHRTFSDLPQILSPGDLLVLNDVRVRPARLHARKPTGGRVELLVLQPGTDGIRRALVRGSAGIRPGTPLRLTSRATDLEGPAVIVGEADGAARLVTLKEGATWRTLLDEWGEMPLPPYIERALAPSPADRDRYQTVYAEAGEAVAAPTAGLHFTKLLLQELADSGIEHARVTLEVGAGTFQPVRTPRLSDHLMHEESYTVPAATAAAVERTESAGGRVVAVGTTSCRSLESWHRLGRPSDGATRRTRLFLRPGDPPRMEMSLLTNFHLPGSTLLALVAALLGRRRTLDLYGTAIGAGYRFYSYGDASLLL
jgi:S-adenosylmethionine:tRNA ribosyltransferase-isomerase